MVLIYQIVQHDKIIYPMMLRGVIVYYVNQEKGIIDVSAATPYNTTYYKDASNCLQWVA